MRNIAKTLLSARAAAFLAAAVAAVCAVSAIWFGGLNQDEGWYLYAAQLVREGLVPYRDFFFTQGPTMPFAYASIAPVWGRSSPLHGLLGARVATFAVGLLATLAAAALAGRLAGRSRAKAAFAVAFAMLSCNIYHVYFTTIPKTYALGSFFVLLGFLLATVRHPAAMAAAGVSLAFAAGTRISLILVIPVVGVGLLVAFRRFGFSFLWFGIGGAAGLFATYGVFALDSDCLRGLLAAQEYHAARGGFDPFFAIGSVSRLARGYAALGATLFAMFLVRGGAAAGDGGGREADMRILSRIMLVSFFAVFLLQLSAPFPYDDYQVPVMGILAALVSARAAARAPSSRAAAWWAVLVAGMCSFSSPLLQSWMTYGQDRFWSRRKETSELAKLRAAAEAVETLDPGGRDILTQDLYLAVECGRRVPRGLEMGPFSYFPAMRTEDARAVRVLGKEDMEALLESAPARIAAFSGYGFAISAPTCDETPFDEQKRLWEILKKHYELMIREEDFGQNATTLLVLRRKEGDVK